MIEGPSVDLQRNLTSETVERANPAPAQPVCYEKSARARDVLHGLKAQRTGAALICHQGILVGIFTERDVLRLLAEGADLDVAIEQLMIRNPVTISPGTKMADVIKKMAAGGFRRLPIVDDKGRPIGLVKVSGILNYLVQHFPNLIYTLPPQPHHTPQEREGA